VRDGDDLLPVEIGVNIKRKPGDRELSMSEPHPAEPRIVVDVPECLEVCGEEAVTECLTPLVVEQQCGG